MQTRYGKKPDVLKEALDASNNSARRPNRRLSYFSLSRDRLIHGAVLLFFGERLAVPL